MSTALKDVVKERKDPTPRTYRIPWFTCNECGWLAGHPDVLEGHYRRKHARSNT